MNLSVLSFSHTQISHYFFSIQIAFQKDNKYFSKCMLHGNWFSMFFTALCGIIFRMKLPWPKNKSLYDTLF